mmetsp:Transcript_22878/g.60447  ORF Transcript_22878/g.60447 Transcript_22878/m.60447 type:complete len:396 (+) Transcript_22878:127-1314(+)
MTEMIAAPASPRPAETAETPAARAPPEPPAAAVAEDTDGTAEDCDETPRPPAATAETAAAPAPPGPPVTAATEDSPPTSYPMSASRSSRALDRVGTLRSRAATLGSLMSIVSSLPWAPRFSEPWRWPSRENLLPFYVTAQFRTKTFLLIGLQLMVVLATLYGTEQAIHGSSFLQGVISTPARTISTSAVFLASLVLLHVLRDVYPANYALLVFVALAAGLFWGVNGGDLTIGADPAYDTWFHYQVLGITCISSIVSALISEATRHFPSTAKMDPWHMLLLLVVPGWLVAVAANLAVSCSTPGEIVTPTSALYPIVLTGVLLGTMLVFDTGLLMMKGNPDDFMRIIVHVDWILLLSVLAVPVVVVLMLIPFGCFCCREVEDAEEPEQEGAWTATAV